MWNTTEVLVGVLIKYLFSGYELQTWLSAAENKGIYRNNFIYWDR